MEDISTQRRHLEDFGRHYAYDTEYLIDLLEASPAAHGAFAAGMAMASFRQELDQTSHFVARIATTQAEDCGPCAQLNLRMALEAGVDRDLLQTLLDEPEALPSPLAEVYRHARAVTRGEAVDSQKGEALRGLLGAEAFAELAVTIAGSRLFPSAKRAMLRADHCQRPTLDEPWGAAVS